MNYGVVQGGRIICDPIPYSASRFRGIIERHSGIPTAIPEVAPTNPVNCGPLWILPSAEKLTLAPNRYAYRRGFTPWIIVDYQLERTSTWQLLPEDGIRKNMLDAIADIRWKYETGGITVDGIKIKTDRESRGTVFDGYSSLASGLLTVGRWKFAGEWKTVTLDEMGPIAAAVSSHVDRAFRAEEVVEQMINDAVNTDALLAIDLQAEFEQALNTL